MGGLQGCRGVNVIGPPVLPTTPRPKSTPPPPHQKCLWELHGEPVLFFCSSQIPLVEQHYSAEFLPFLKPTYKVERVSGDSQLKISFTDTVRKNDVIICTAQILENYLERSRAGEDEGVNLSGMAFRRFPQSLLSQNRVGGSAQLILVWLFFETRP